MWRRRSSENFQESLNIYSDIFLSRHRFQAASMDLRSEIVLYNDLAVRFSGFVGHEIQKVIPNLHCHWRLRMRRPRCRTFLGLLGSNTCIIDSIDDVIHGRQRRSKVIPDRLAFHVDAKRKDKATACLQASAYLVRIILYEFEVIASCE
jgi:hypothetical protein